MTRRADEPRPLIWRGPSKTDFMAFPPTVQREMGYALFLAQMGERHSTMARTLGGFGGATVIEVKESHDGNAYRAERCATPTRSTCFTRSRRNQGRASRRPRQKST